MFPAGVWSSPAETVFCQVKGVELMKKLLVLAAVMSGTLASGVEEREAVKSSLDARDSITPNFLQNSDMVNEMTAVDAKAVWSLLDQKGTQTMMKSVLGEASQLADFDTVKNRMKSSRYTMDFQNGV